MIVKQGISSWKVEVDLVAPEFGLEVKRWLSGKKKRKKKTCRKITVRYTIHISTNLSKICFKKSVLTAFWVSPLYFIAINISSRGFGTRKKILNDFRRADFVENYNKLEYTIHIFSFGKHFVECLPW